jgi:membrane protease YdiL (CAAX protease family)
MFTELSNRTKGIVFYLITMVLAITVAALAPPKADGVELMSMLAPTIALLLMLLVVTKDGLHRAAWSGLGLHRAGFRYWPLAIGLPIVLIGLSYAMASLVLEVTWTVDADKVLNFVVRIAFVSAFAILEEVGWRGYLLPRFTVGDGRTAAVVVGFLHGLYHLPLIVLTTAYNPLGARAIIIPIFLIVLTAAGAIYGFLRVASASLWPVILAHGSFNAVLGSLDDVTVSTHPVTLAYLTTETGVFTAVLVLITAVVLSRRQRVLFDSGLERGAVAAE